MRINCNLLPVLILLVGILWFSNAKAQTKAPVLIFDEDFTDGAFDDYGAGVNGQNWRINSSNQGVAFRTPNNRPNIPQALSRIPSLGTSGWAGANFAIWNDANNNGWYNDGELETFLVDKHNDVVVLEYTAFSDLARKVNTYGVEVAMLEWADTLAGPPHYNHDLSFEAMQSFHVNPAEGPVQLFANVENQETWSPAGVKRSHYSSNGGLASDATLSQLWTNKVLWRNMPGTGQTNIEQWGHLNQADYNVNSEMNNMYQPNSQYAVFSYVQITFFRSPLNTGNPFLVRNGVLADSAQVGTTHCKLGITKKSDFNLDYTTNQADLQILTTNLNRPDSATLLTGDATNDQAIDLRDANPLAAFWHQHVVGTPQARAWYNPTNGNLHLSTKHIAFARLTAPSGTFAQTPNLSFAQTGITEHTDSSIAFFVDAGTNLDSLLLTTVASGMLASDFDLTVNYCGSQQSQGFKVPLNTAVFTHTPNSLSTPTMGSVRLHGVWIEYPHQPGQAHQITIFNLLGQPLYQAPLNQMHAQLLPAALPRTPLLLQITNGSGRLLLSKIIPGSLLH